jgi:hypothetical protein
MQTGVTKMNNVRWRNFVAVWLAMAMCSGGALGGEKTRRSQSVNATSFVSILTPNGQMIRPAYQPTGDIAPTCDVGPGLKPQVSKVVTLHLSNARLGNLSNGITCPDCLTQRSPGKVCDTDGIHCLDDDGTGPPVPFPALSQKDSDYDYNTQFDIDLRGRWDKDPRTKAYRPVLLKISLDDQNMSFIRGTTSDHTDPGVAVQRGPDSASDAMFDCLQSIVTTTDKTESVELRISRLPAGPRKHIIGSLNIGIVIKEPGNSLLTIPIILDPKVPNNG